MLVDLHVHTNLSTDSNVSAERYLDAIAAAGKLLDAICFTEHRLYPMDAALDARYAELSERFGVRVFKGIEADTDLGHLLLFGITPALIKNFDLTDRMLRSEQLIAAVDAEGGVAVPAHPFRDSGFGERLGDLRAKVGDALRAIEAINGQNTPRQNELGIHASHAHRLAAVAGSDAHFVTPRWFLTTATRLERPVRTIEELCAELRAGRARPHVFNHDGHPGHQD